MPGGPIIHSNSDLDTNPDSQDSEEIDTLDSAIREALTEKGEKLQQYQMVSRHVKRFLADQPGSVDINQWYLLLCISHAAGSYLMVRCQLWGTLAKIARKNGVWDVARTAATFCLEYNEKGDCCYAIFTTIESLSMGSCCRLSEEQPEQVDCY